ncbi:PfkB family carbohydrate kinase [Longispora sp. K20-0274]|uniref:PfkB family carbohydrate kinase n=1 Tax=Longispora sp. K20-0274 TaxID=3088255 RepID=UPI00399A8B5F
MRPTVLVVGSVNVDIVVRATRRPGPGETLPADGIDWLPGGKGANQATAAARAGARALLVAAVGTDAYGDAMLRGLAGQGVDVTGCRRIEGPTGYAVITVTPDGENSILVPPGANRSLTGVDTVPADVVLAQLEIPLAAVLRAAAVARDNHARLVLNASPAAPLPPDLLAAADPLLVNAPEAATLLGRPDGTAADLVAAGARSAVLTRGAAGADWADGDGSGHVPAGEVSPVDTTGAGDAFAGTLAAALAGGAALPAAVERAVRAGTEATAWRGAQPWRLP